MAQALDKPVYFILNKADAEQAEITKAALKEKEAVIAVIPADPQIMMAGLRGEALDIEIPAINAVIDRIKK